MKLNCKDNLRSYSGQKDVSGHASRNDGGGVSLRERRDRYADKTLGEKAIASVLDIHRGAVLGWPGKLAFMIAAALMSLFAITGVLLYLSRRKLRRPEQPPLGRLVPGE